MDWDAYSLLGLESIGVEADRLSFLISYEVYAVLALDGVSVFFLGVEALEALVVEFDRVVPVMCFVFGRFPRPGRRDGFAGGRTGESAG